MLCLYGGPLWGLMQSIGCSTSAIMHAVWMTYGLRKYDHVSAARHNLGWLPFDLLVWYHALVLMYRHYIHDNCVQLDSPFQFGSIIICMELDSPHIFVTFFSIQLLLDRDFSDHNLQRGGTVFLAHCLIVHLLIFQLFT